MARDKRSNRPPSGPVRTTRRTRPTPSSAASANEPLIELPERSSPLAKAASRITRPQNRLGLTRRALMLFSVLALLAVSFAGSLQVWITQSNDLALAQEQITERTARAESLETELRRWDDPSFVRAQARARLGWVVPGEVGYRVIGEDGQVLSGTAAIEGVGHAQRNELDARWWDRMASSLSQADDPQPTAASEPVR